MTPLLPVAIGLVAVLYASVGHAGATEDDDQQQGGHRQA